MRELARQGHRAGGARVAVVERLGASGGCVTARELLEQLRGSGVGAASVYRTLNLLVDNGLLQRAAIGGSSTRYDLVHPEQGRPHHHLLCERCGRTLRFEDEAIDAVIAQAAARIPFTVDSHDVTLRGACAECTDETSGASSS